MSTRKHIVRRRPTIAWVLAVAFAASAHAAVEVRVEGLGDELARNVRAFLSIAELEDAGRDAAAPSEDERDDGSPEDDEDATEARIRRLHAAAEGEIAAALQPFGYYEPAVTATLERDGDDWVARYVVDPGPPTTITEVDIRVVGEGADDPAVRAARQAITLAPGQVLRHARYEAAKQALFDAAYNAGFIDVMYRRSELRVHRARREAS